MRIVSLKWASVVALTGILASGAGAFGTGTGYQVTFNTNIDLQNVFVYADQWNGDVYAWTLLPQTLGQVNAGSSTYALGNPNVQAWAILATYGQVGAPNGVATSINDSLAPSVYGQDFATVFPGSTESTVQADIQGLFTGGSYNTVPAFALVEFVLANENTLKTDLPTGTLPMVQFSGGTSIGTATFSPVPEPTTLLVGLIGLGGLAMRRRRQR